MKKLNNKIDMFCYRHPRFGVPNLMLYIVVISLAVWLLSIMDSSRTLMSYFAFSPELILKGQVWRLITFMFIPQDTSMWALLFFYFYYWIGSTLEREWGTARFNIFIFSGVLLTIIYGMVIYLITKQSASIGTYYIYLSMFFSFATLYPDTQVLFMFIIPVKIKWLAYIDAAFFIFEMIATPFPFNLLPLIAMFNYFIFFGADLISELRSKRVHYSKTTVNFNREKQKIKYEQRQKNYTYKCSVCGRTDVDFPNLEFRYCSKCAGYHCFCQDHINNHVHFTE
ncbi:putative uncharacterized protein [Firmicutes bacterium CAG:240]|jgi:hypothetical protein|nr:MAG: hypothetical protein BHW36_07340 [Firmicutes bacterium CAG:24053_14]CDB43869.1 putative uncharacterized protein [Firmicutes bacterium CAG:240]